MSHKLICLIFSLIQKELNKERLLSEMCISITVILIIVLSGKVFLDLRSFFDRTITQDFLIMFNDFIL